MRVRVLRSAELDPVDCWGDVDAIDGVLGALSASGVSTQLQVVRSADDLAACRHDSDLLIFPHSRRYGANEPMVEPLEAWGVPLVGSGVAGLAALDKVHAKTMLDRHGIPTPRWSVATAATDPGELVDLLGLPLIVKPICGAESHGVLRCDDIPAIGAAIGLGGDRVLVEEWRRYRELTIALLGNPPDRLAAVGEITLAAGASYLDSETKNHRIVPTLSVAPEDAVTRRAVSMVMEACRVLEIRDWARVDVVIDRFDDPHIVDINAMPGLRRDPDHPSYFPRCFQNSYGWSYREVVLALVMAAIDRCGG